MEKLTALEAMEKSIALHLELSQCKTIDEKLNVLHRIVEHIDHMVYSCPIEELNPLFEREKIIYNNIIQKLTDGETFVNEIPEKRVLN